MYLVQKEAWEQQAGKIQRGAARHCGHTDGENQKHSLLRKSGINSSPVLENISGLVVVRESAVPRLDPMPAWMSVDEAYAH